MLEARQGLDERLVYGSYPEIFQLGLRNDTGVLWESYILSERIKKLRYSGSLAHFYFWRNYQQQEIDCIEFENGELRAYEIKYSSSKKVKTPSGFMQSYPGVEVQQIDRDNYLEFVT